MQTCAGKRALLASSECVEIVAPARENLRSGLSALCCKQTVAKLKLTLALRSAFVELASEGFLVRVNQDNRNNEAVRVIQNQGLRGAADDE